MAANLVEIFYFIDEFCKEIEKTMEGHILPKDTYKKTRKRAFTMSDSEVITIMILFHKSHIRDLKAFYVSYIQRHCQEDFPHTVSYNRFVELQFPWLSSFNCAVWANVQAYLSLIQLPSVYATLNEKSQIKYSKSWLPMENPLSAGSLDLNCTWWSMIKAKSLNL
jgi:hypothetical protein